MAIDTTQTCIVDSATGNISYPNATPSAPISLATQPQQTAMTSQDQTNQLLTAILIELGGSANFIPK